jgi:5-formyltetrahydrofolate cyclo-ligase
MQIKSELRKQIKIDRKNVDDKLNKDTAICNSLLSSNIYKNAKAILCYLATDSEINADSIILTALKDNKVVAVPYCVDNNGTMDFYVINSLNQLELGSFNIREPNIQKSAKFNSFDNSLIVVPALCFDKKGNRLGYGKGYYDRFLQKHPLISVGLCYNSFVKNEIPTGEFDKAVDYIITERKIIDCNNGG